MTTQWLPLRLPLKQAVQRRVVLHWSNAVEAVHTSQTTQRTTLLPLPVRSSFEAHDNAVTRRETAIGIGGFSSALSPSSAVSPPSACALCVRPTTKRCVYL